MSLCPGASAPPPEPDPTLDLLGPALDEALRSSLGAERVRPPDASPASVDVGPDSAGRLSVPAPRAPGERVHLLRAAPFDEADARLAREVVDVVAGLVGSWSARADQAASYVEGVLDALDAVPVATVEERLALVARSAAAWLGVTGWSVCFLDRGHPVPVLREGPSDATRGLRTPADGPGLPEDLRLAFEGGSLVRTVAADEESPATGHGLQTLVAAGGYDVDALQWLVCLVADGPSADLWVGRAAVSAAVQAALGFPRGPLRGR